VQAFPVIVADPTGMDLSEDMTVSDTDIHVFDEQQNVSVTLLAYDDDAGDANTLTPGTYTGNVDSHHIHMEPTADDDAIRGRGCIEFATDIIALIISDSNLDDSDSEVGLGTVTYPYGLANRGLEVGSGSNYQDEYEIVGNVLKIDFQALNVMDGVRVLTEPYIPAELDGLVHCGDVPDPAYNPLGFEWWHCVKATVDPPESGATVYFEVEGAHNITTSRVTNDSGEAIFCYFGINPGEDTILAYTNMNGVPGYQEGEDIGLELTKFWLQHYITGGGNINTGRGKNEYKITFGGNVGLMDDYGDPVGQWNVNFHNVSVDALDKGHFHTTEITSLTFKRLFMCDQPDPPDAYFNWAWFKADGRFKGQDGWVEDWSIDVRVADFGEGKHATDSIRILLYNDADVLVYDSWASGDFDAEDTCGWIYRLRHRLDGGNIQIHPPEMPIT
jgi:hypothetical protein